MIISSDLQQENVFDVFYNLYKEQEHGEARWDWSLNEAI